MDRVVLGMMVSRSSVTDLPRRVRACTSCASRRRAFLAQHNSATTHAHAQGTNQMPTRSLVRDDLQH